MKKQVLFAVLQDFADWEYAFLAAVLQDGMNGQPSKYEVKTLSLEAEPVKSIGNFTILPDYTPTDVPEDFTGLILIGGKSWRKEEAKKLLPLVNKVYTQGKMLGAICDATVFLGMNGLMNEKEHTSNTREELIRAAGDAYTGKERYVSKQAVRDGNLVTANGSAPLEFMREVLLALEAFTPEEIEGGYRFYKEGLIRQE